MNQPRSSPTMTLKEATGIARNMFLSGYHCSEAIFAAIAQSWTDDYEPRLLKMATPFGGGIAEQADLCGCVAGGAMVLGLLYGRESTEENTSVLWSVTERFHKRFRDELGSTSCFYFTKGNFNKVNYLRCHRLVSKTVRILWELIEEQQSKSDSHTSSP